MASAWTSPSLALLKPARVTENSIELVAQGSCGTGLALDELALIDGKTFGQMIYALAGGQGKARMTTGATARKLERHHVADLRPDQLRANPREQDHQRERWQMDGRHGRALHRYRLLGSQRRRNAQGDRRR
jgi:Domain of unknown function (DUF927)